MTPLAHATLRMLDEAGIAVHSTHIDRDGDAWVNVVGPNGRVLLVVGDDAWLTWTVGYAVCAEVEIHTPAELAQHLTAIREWIGAVQVAQEVP